MPLSPLEPSAFRSALEGELDAKVDVSSLTTDGDLLTRAALTRVGASFFVLMGARLEANFTFVRATTSWVTQDQWPSTLPGTAA